MAKLIDLTGQRFGRLTVVDRAENYTHFTLHQYGPPDKTTLARWNCVCDCGNTRTVIGVNLIHGKTQSCGCLRAERRREAARCRQNA